MPSPQGIRTTPEQRRVLASPARLEILGHFTDDRPMTVAEIAERTGRTRTSVYHHVRLLEGVGLLEREGLDTGGEGRNAVRYRAPCASLEVAHEGTAESLADVCRTMDAALRMTARDFEAALASGNVVPEGPERNFLGARLHVRMTPGTLARINHHLDEIMALVRAETARHPLPPDARHLCSLTLALLPLPGRVASSSSDRSQP